MKSPRRGGTWTSSQPGPGSALPFCIGRARRLVFNFRASKLTRTKLRSSPVTARLPSGETARQVRPAPSAAAGSDARLEAGSDGGRRARPPSGPQLNSCCERTSGGGEAPSGSAAAPSAGDSRVAT